MKKPSFALVGLALLFRVLAATPTPQMPLPDLLLTGGRVVDGPGAPYFYADVAVQDGLIVAPGFIDLLGQSSAST